MFVLQNSSYSFLVQLLDLTGEPVTNVTYLGVTGFIRKQGALSFTGFPVTALNFFYVGNSYYNLTVSSSDTNTAGSLSILLQGPSFKDSLQVLTVVASMPVLPATPSASVTSSTIYGLVATSAGPAADVKVSLKMLSSPAVVSSSGEGVGIVNDTKVTKTDASGYFSLTGVVDLQYEIWIPSLNYRKVFVMPSTNKNVFDI
jgi:hypothetical protein